MDTLYTILSVVYVLVCLFLILVVLLQSGKGGGMGALGGGATPGGQTVFGGAGAGNFLTRLTAINAGLFMVLSATLAYLSTKGEKEAEANIEAAAGVSEDGDMDDASMDSDMDSAMDGDMDSAMDGDMDGDMAEPTEDSPMSEEPSPLLLDLGGEETPPEEAPIDEPAPEEAPPVEPAMAEPTMAAPEMVEATMAAPAMADMAVETTEM
jgi:preprotein translocase subunit SecG